MKIMCQEYFDLVKKYAEEIGDKSFQGCLDRFKMWEENPNRPCEIELYPDREEYSFNFTQLYPDEKIGLQGGLVFHPNRNNWQIHT